MLEVKHGYAFPGDGFGQRTDAPQVLTPGNFALGGGFQAAKPKSFDGEYPGEFLLQGGEVVVTMTDLSKAGDTLGFAAVLPDGEFLHNQRIGLVRLSRPELLDERYFAYLTRTDGYRAHIIGTASGSTVRHTSPSRIGDYWVELPSLAVQRATAEVLGALDDKIAANTNLAFKAMGLASLLFDRATIDARVVAMSEVLTPVLGGTPSRARDDYWGGSNLWISAKDATNASNSVVLGTEEHISDLAIRETKAKPLPAGSVILTARGTVGAVARLAVPASFNQSCYGFAPDGIPSSILYFGIRRAADRAKAIAHGSVFDTITMKTFQHLEFPSFSPADAAQLDARLAPLLAAVDEAMRSNRTLAATRDTLLPQLMSGNLRVRDLERSMG